MHLPRVLPFVLALAASVSGLLSDFNYPESDIKATKCLGMHDCLYANPDSCTSFIYCEPNDDGVTGAPVVQDCPNGLLWNDKKKECDIADETTCVNEQE